MASSIALAFLAFAIIGTTNAATPKFDKEKMKEAAMGMINDCKQKVGASDDDIKAMQEKKMPTTKEGQCLVECVFNTANIMKNGQLNKEGAIQAFTPALNGDVTKLGKLKEMMDVCDKELSTEKDGCVAAKKLVDCCMEKGKSFGFEFPSES